MKLKDRCNTSNNCLNYLPQGISFQRRILCFRIRELNLQALTPHQENSSATCKVLPSDADMATPLISQSYAKPELIVPQNHCDRKHPEARIKVVRIWLDNRQDAMHHIGIYNGTWESNKQQSHITTYMSNEQLQAMELCIIHGIMVHTNSLEHDRVTQMFRYTGSYSWLGKD